VKLVHLVDFITKKFVTMYGHMKVFQMYSVKCVIHILSITHTHTHTHTYTYIYIVALVGRFHPFTGHEGP